MARLVVVGDVHGCWDPVLDEKALEFLHPDLVLFTGDFGDEDVKLVEQIGLLGKRKAVILGNHDVYCTPVQKTKKKRSPVHEELSALGESHVGFGRMDLHDLRLSVVGARPFATGGEKMYAAAVIEELYGISDMKGSARKIAEAAKSAPNGYPLIFLGHNGPTGLGSQRNDLCGKDFEKKGGDHGDPDLEEALKECSGSRKVPLVVFGHMHHKLLITPGDRKMVTTKSDTVYVNGAVVPRERMRGKHRNFTTVELSTEGKVEKVSQVWVSVDDTVEVVDETVLYYCSKSLPKKCSKALPKKASSNKNKKNKR